MRWVARLAAFALMAVVSANGPEPVRQRGGLGRAPSDGSWIYDGGFVFCRIAFRNSLYGDGNGWSVDYPRADLNLPFRLGQLTKTSISRDSRGEPNHVVITLTDPKLFECPFVMMTEPGGSFLGDDEAARLREYLDKGGFLWADDFWGEKAWNDWEGEIRKALPAAGFPIVDLPLEHPIFHMLYEVKKVPQIPSIQYWLSYGHDTSERVDSRVPHVRAINNADGHVIVLMTHNTDFGDAFEREGDNRAYFERFATEGYSFGINVILYAMTH